MDEKKPGDRDAAGAAPGISRRELLGVLGGGAILFRREDWWSRISESRPPTILDDWHYASLSDLAKLIQAREVWPESQRRYAAPSRVVEVLPFSEAVGTL